MNPTRRGMRGVATVEFAVIGAAFFLVLIGSIEISRAMFTWNSIAEGTRRAARLAAVCPINDPAIAETAILNAPDDTGTDSQFLHGLKTTNVSVQYLNAAGAVTTNPPDVSYVRVSIAGYQHTLLVPFLPTNLASLTVPPFATTVPTESLGFSGPCP